MTRISSYNIYQCPNCGQGHVLPNYASISKTAADDAYVADDDQRICFGCGFVNSFKEFKFSGSIQKPRPDFTPAYVKFLKKLFGFKQIKAAPYPTKIYPYLNPKK
jgi:hypothetical protein